MEIIKDKRGLEFRSAFFAIIALSMAIIAIGIWVNDWNEEYSSGLVFDLGGDFDKLDEISGEAEDQEGKVTVSSTNTNERFEDTSLRGVFGILNNLYAPLGVVFGDNGMIDAVTERFGIPDYIRQGLVTIMVIGITFALVAIFFRLPRTSA